MVHKPRHKVHSFRGALGDSGQDKINLERQNVTLAYRIVKFSIITNSPGTATLVHVVKIYKEKQTSVTGTIDFTDPNLLGCAVNQGLQAGNSDIQIIFENEIFSRNIYLTAKEIVGASGTVNYYIELEEVPVSAATLMQLKLGVARKLSLSESPPD